MTAQVVTFARAVLSRDASGCIVDDPHASAMLAAPFRLALRIAGSPLGDAVLRHVRFYRELLGTIGARTLLFDRAIVDALDRGVRTVVLLGAGYDARALRLHREGVRFFEVDHPATQRDKRYRLADAGLGEMAVFVSLDFTRDRLDHALLAAGFDDTTPAFFLWEGVTGYLAEADVRATLGHLTRLARPGSALAFDVVERLDGRLLSALRGHGMRLLGEPLQLWMTRDTPRGLLAEYGWDAIDVLFGDAVAARFPEIDRLAVFAGNGFVLAARTLAAVG